MFIFCRLLSILFYQTTVTELPYFIINTYVKSRENAEHQYWPDQNLPIRVKNLYWPTCPILTELFYLYYKGSSRVIYVNITVVN